MTERDLSGLRAHAESLTQQFQQLRGDLQTIQQHLAAVRGTATSSDGFVKVTVGPRGQLVDLQLDGRIYRRPDSTRLAATITETVQRAVQDAATKAEAISARHAPDSGLTSYLRGDLAERFARFDFIRDELAGSAEE